MTTLQANKGKVPIFILSLVALVFTSIGSVSYFLSFGLELFEVHFYFPDVISLISMELAFLPLLALVVYALVFYKNNKAPILVTIIWGLYAFSILFSFITIVTRVSLGARYLLNILLELSVTALAAVFATKKLGKLFGISASAVLALLSFSNFITILGNISNGYMPAAYAIFDFFRNFGYLAFAGAMLLISLLRKTGTAVPAAPEFPTA